MKTSHEIARELLSKPDLPIAISAMGHTYLSGHHDYSHGELKIVNIETRGETFILLSHMINTLVDLSHGDIKIKE